jgi:thymidylate synthase (FAD)
MKFSMNNNITSRAITPELEKILEYEFKILDHGFIRVIDYMGNDNAIVQAARVSYGAGTKQVREDAGLINYLLRNSHTTPFEMCEIKFHIKAPYFVARQWIRHRTANVNEYSARYSIVDQDYYLPNQDEISFQSSNNKQGRGEQVDEDFSDSVREIIKNTSDQQYEHYNKMLESGLAREVARIILPLNYYTEFYWKIDLHNLMHFLRLRADSHAQYEIRLYALQMIEILKLWVPHTYQAFQDYKMNSKNLSEKMLSVMKKMIAGEKVDQENSGLSKREWTELLSIVN